jgi:hypothetical protein
MRTFVLVTLIVALCIVLYALGQGLGESFGHGLREIDVR